MLEKQQEFVEKLEEVCDNLTSTENHLIGHQQQVDNAESVTDLQQYQEEHQVRDYLLRVYYLLLLIFWLNSSEFTSCLCDPKALQKDVLTNASALHEVIASTKKFLEENRSKLSPDQIAVLESRLETAQSKGKLIDQRVEESRKDLEKVVTTTIKKESEKVK